MNANANPVSKYTFYRSRFSPTIRFRPVFFYHLPKCGGSSIFSMADLTWRAMCDSVKIDPPVMSRCDTPEHEEAFGAQPYGFIASRLPFGLHARLPGAPMLMTVLRHPLQRLRSAYGYTCMREGRTASLEGFRDFTAEPANTDLMTKLLSGNALDGEATAGDLEAVQRRLETEFAFVATTAGIQAVSESLLQLFSLPNVIAMRINPTHRKFNIDPAPLADDIAAANPLDTALFDAYRDRPPQLPPAEDNDPNPPLYPLTLILCERGDEEGSMVRGISMETRRVFDDGLMDFDGTLHPEALDRTVEFELGT